MTNMTLENAIGPDSGLVRGTNLAGQDTSFYSRTTVSLRSKDWGELRLGRDRTPPYYVIGQYDPFNFNGVGSVGNFLSVINPAGKTPAATGAVRTLARIDNSAQYFLPPGLAGLYGQFVVAAAEGVPAGKYIGLRLGHASGPLDVSLAYARDGSLPDNIEFQAIGSSYDLGPAKLMGSAMKMSAGTARRYNYIIGAIIPLGASQFRLSWMRTQGKGALQGASLEGTTANQFAIGYAYYLSKRTTLYTNASVIRNDRNSAYIATGNPSLGSAITTYGKGKRARGLESGIRFAF